MAQKISDVTTWLFGDGGWQRKDYTFPLLLPQQPNAVS